MSNLSIIQGDLNELKALKTQCKRDGVKMILSNQIRLLEEKQRNMCISDIGRRPTENTSVNIAPQPEILSRKSPQNLPLEAYTPITKYSWDQTDKNVKIYIDLPGVQDKPDSIDIKFGKDNLEMHVKNLENKFYSFTVKLHDEITTSECSHKIKKDMVVITLRKLRAANKWPRLSYKDSPLKKSAAGSDIGSGLGGLGNMSGAGMKDPMAGIQDLMKKMYEEGDDEMKRTIAKAWTEAQSKNMKMP
ncbi:SGS domain-containing protein [Cryptosporidium felis]|nr:SGS domain-containing protein [Cryptosporidium felis]